MLRFRQVKTATLTLLLCGTAKAQSGPLISFLLLPSARLKLRLPGGERIHQALRGRVPNSLFFPLPLSSPAAEISSSVHTMVLSSIVFNTKGPTIAPMENASIAHRLKQLKWDLSLKTGAAQPWRGIKLGQTL